MRIPRNIDETPSWPFPLLAIPMWSRSEGVTTLEGSDRNIDGWSIATLIVFLLVNVLVIFPLRIPLPLFVSGTVRRLLVILKLRSPAQESAGNNVHPDHSGVSEKPVQVTGEKRWHFTLGLNTAPVVGVLLLLATTCIPGSVVRKGIVGSGGVRPYDIMTLFICFAYISVSLDSTGLLRYLAFLVASRASSSGSLLYSAFYVFFAISGLLVGNDPLILSGTPFLAYFTSHADINPPTAYLFTHFQVSNLVSALLVSSNPTNLVLTSAFGISFLSYSAWLALPTVAGVVTLFPMLRFWVFRKQGMIPTKLSPPQVDAKAALRDPWGGIFGAGLFIVTIVLLVGLSAGGKLEGVQGVWTVTAPAALIMLLRDVIHDLRHRSSTSHVNSMEAEKSRNGTSSPHIDSERGGAPEELDVPVNSSEPAPGSSSPSAEPLSEQLPDETTQVEGIETSSREDGSEIVTGTPSKAEPVSTALSEPEIEPAPTQSTGASTPPKVIRPQTSPPILRPFTALLPNVCGTISRLPFSLLPFAFSMFILVEGLQHTGWIRVFGRWWTAWADVGGVAGCVWLMGMISVLGCNVFGTNIGATILLSRVLQQWQATSGPVSSRSLYGAVFALAVGSNFGAYSFVFSASLAGLLWRDILGQKAIHIRPTEFIYWNWLPVIVTMIVGCLVVAGEVCVMYKT